jgi:hypothetical protein
MTTTAAPASTAIAVTEPVFSTQERPFASLRMTVVISTNRRTNVRARSLV